MANFVLKITNFRYHGNGGRSEQFIWHLKKADLNTPYRVQTPWLYLSYNPLWVEIRKFRYHGNRGRCEQSLTNTLKLAFPKYPYQVQLSRSYLLCKLSYSPFCVEIRNFSLPWQQGSVWAKFEWRAQIGWPSKPTTSCKCHGHISYASWVTANFVLKISNFRYHGKGSVWAKFDWHP